MRRLLAVVVLGTALSLVAEAAASQVPAELRSAEALAARLEAGQISILAGDELWDDLETATVDAELALVTRYLASHPGDVAALLLTVRLGRVRDLLAFRDAYMRLYEDPSAGEPAIPSLAGHLAVLDTVLARDSTVAAAHYWKARLLLEETARAAGLAAPQDASALSTDLQAEVLAHARSGVLLDPDNVAHREFLALLLVLDEKLQEASAVLEHPSTARSLIRSLTLDLLTFAPPPPAEHDAVMFNFMLMVATMGAADLGDLDQALFLELRARGWSTPMRLAEVEAHYRAKWPGLRFFQAEAWDGGVAAAFVQEDGGWRPVGDEREFEAADRASGGTVTILLLPPAARDEMSELAVSQGMPRDRILPGERVGILLLNARTGR